MMRDLVNPCHLAGSTVISSTERIHMQGDITHLFHSVVGQTWHTNLPTAHSDVEQGRK